MVGTRFFAKIYHKAVRNVEGAILLIKVCAVFDLSWEITVDKTFYLVNSDNIANLDVNNCKLLSCVDAISFLVIAALRA